MCCENCKCEHDEKYGSGRFCSSKCARGFATKSKRKEINEKVSKSLSKESKDVTLKCKECKTDFTVVFGKRNQQTCSKSCQSKLRWKNKDYREKMSKSLSELATKRHQNENDNFGWQVRKQIEPSYPESIAIRWFEENNIEFEREVKVGKYFIDFVINDNIAIEIDGQQHELEERKISDKKKDKILIEKGYNVYRIKFASENIRKRLSEIV